MGCGSDKAASVDHPVTSMHKETGVLSLYMSDHAGAACCPLFWLILQGKKGVRRLTAANRGECLTFEILWWQFTNAN